MMHACILNCFSHIQLLTTPWTVFHWAPLSMGFFRQKYWSGLPYPSPGDLLTQGLNLRHYCCTAFLKLILGMTAIMNLAAFLCDSVSYIFTYFDFTRCIQIWNFYITLVRGTFYRCGLSLTLTKFIVN